MYPEGLPSAELHPEQQASTEVTDITKYRSKSKFAGLILTFFFILIVLVTVTILWYLDTQRTGKPPDVQNEAKQLIEEAKKELGQ